MHRKYLQKWLKEHPENVVSHRRTYCLKHKKEMIEKSQKHRSKMRAYLKEMLGNTCAICGKDLANAKYGSFALHEKTGKRHPTHNDAMLKNKENLGLVCHKGIRGCHSFCHVLLDLGYTFDDAQRIHKLQKNRLLPLGEANNGDF
jgi:hypothetical protein